MLGIVTKDSFVFLKKCVLIRLLSISSFHANNFVARQSSMLYFNLLIYTINDVFLNE